MWTLLALWLICSVILYYIIKYSYMKIGCTKPWSFTTKTIIAFISITLLGGILLLFFMFLIYCVYTTNDVI